MGSLVTEATEARQGSQKNFKRNSAERFRVMEVWLERAGPWVEVLLKGVEVTVKVAKGRPKLVAAVVATSATSLLFYRYITKNFNKFEKLGIPYEKGHFPPGSFNLL